MTQQITALLEKLKEDADLREKLLGANDLDAAEALVKEAGFDVSKADWLKYEANQTLELSDEELVDVAGGIRAKPRGEGTYGPQKGSWDYMTRNVPRRKTSEFHL